ncbi:methyltransferase [Amycolatopsis sp. WAC 04197]|uniref:methyltransferase n=1 Tax=Amycolatopsis sp. WAC 04197 TaxID=2203199 RepID=UPI0013151BF4|nr:methyltransferase [Amycolatopsis sp. WAC 04197]
MTTETSDQTAHSVRMMELLTGFQMSQAVFVAAELDLATLLLDGPRTVADLAQRVGADADALTRVIRILVPYGVFELTSGLVSVTPLGKSLASGVPGSVRDIARYFRQTHYLPFQDLLHTARTGQPAARHHLGMPFFDWITESDHLTRLQNSAMAAGLGGRDDDFFDGYDLPPGEVVADIGGSDGTVLLRLLARYPARAGILFDLPEVVAGATSKVAAADDDRVRVVGGSFFDTVPAADIYILSVVLHNWDDTQAGRILANIARSAPARARLVLIEMVLPDETASAFTAAIDLTMLAMLGGRERTATEWRDLLGRNGFTLNRVVPTPTPFAIIEATLR